MDAIFLTSAVPINLSTLFRPLGAYQLAWYLRQHDYKIQVIDFIFRMSGDEILELIDKFMTPETKILALGWMMLHDPRLPGIGAFIKKMERVVQESKQRYPWIKVCVGGSTSSYWARSNTNRMFDFILTGYAENGMLCVFNHIYRNGPHPTFELVDGHKMIRDNFALPNNGVTFDIENCNHIWDDTDCVMSGETLPLEMSRGCIFNCKFCRYPYIGKSKNDFTRSMECVKDELINNYSRWGIINYYMLDDTFNADQVRLKEFAKMISTLPFRIRYTTYLRPDLLEAHPDSPELLFESGLRGTFIGVETLHPDASKLIGKSWSGKRAKEYVPELYHNIWGGNVATTIGLIAGLPPETLADCYETNKWAIENQFPDIDWNALTVWRDAHGAFKSDFDVNSEQYGFRWVSKNGYATWETDYCDAETAAKWKIELVENNKPFARPASWYLFELGNYGYNLETIKDTRWQALDWKEIGLKRSQWFESYKQKLKNLPT